MGSHSAKPTLQDYNDIADEVVKILNLPKQESSCPICTDNITAKTGCSTLGCGHSFHLKCIGQWLQTNDTCPMCRCQTGEYDREPLPLTEEQEEEQIVYTEGPNTATLNISWSKDSSGVWTRHVEVISEPVVWVPGSGPCPYSLVQWMRQQDE